MFVLVGVKDTIPVAPAALQIPAAVTIQDALNKKYANRLIAGKGLALSVFDISTAEDGRVTWGNGLMYYKVSFRLMLFAPFIGEVIVGKIMATTSTYIRVTLEFYQDVFIPSFHLPGNSAYDRSQRKWFWYSDPEADEDEKAPLLSQTELFNTVVADRLYMDVGDVVRFRVDSVVWKDIRPEPPNIPQTASASAPALANGEGKPMMNGDAHGSGHGLANGNGHGPDEDKGDGSQAEREKDPMEKAAFAVIGSFADSGLGLVHWWDASSEEMEE